MAEYEIWKFLHICMFVFWLGTDVGVMLCSKKSVDPALSIEASIERAGSTDFFEQSITPTSVPNQNTNIQMCRNFQISYSAII